MNISKKNSLVFLLLTLGIFARSQEISPMLVGTNVWYTDLSETVWDLTEESGVGSFRIGGHQYDVTVPSNTQLLEWVNRIQAMGAQPILQVSEYGSPEAAAALVKYFNIDSTSGQPIKYWNIGNEPWLQNGRPAVTTAGAMVAAYFKPIAAAMKEVDSTIKIIGPDFCYYLSEGIDTLFGSGSENDIAVKIPGKNYYYCDGISWHRYPQDGNINLAYEGIEDFKGAIIACKQKVDEVNAKYDRTGDDALIWGIGEYNAKGGAEVHTWENGQMFGGVLGLCMKYDATYATSWSMFENGGSRQGSDFSFIDGDMTPRASYRHMQMLANNFNGQYIDGVSDNDDFIVFGSKNEDTVSVMIMNRKVDAPKSYTLHLNLSGNSDNQVQLNIDGNSDIVYSDFIAGRATQLLVFKNDTIIRTNYTSYDFDNGLPPSTSQVIIANTPPSSPTSLVANTISYKSISLNWSAVVGDTITGYIIERKEALAAEFNLLTSVSSSETSFTDNYLNDTTAYTYRVYAYNTAGSSIYSNESTDTTYSIPPQKAFNGPHYIPGLIEVEDYNDNDEGIGYHDADVANQGEAYRLDQGVDVQECTDTDGGYNIGYIADGEWLKYSIENVTDGTYDIELRIASDNTTSAKNINVYLNNELLGIATAHYTGGWQNWESIYIDEVAISGDVEKNVLELRLEGESFNINYINIATDLYTPSSITNDNKISKNNDLLVYYNSSENALKLRFSEIIENAQVQLIGLDGRSIISTSKNDFLETSIVVPNLGSGIYVVVVNTDKGSYSQKLFIRK